MVMRVHVCLLQPNYSVFGGSIVPCVLDSEQNSSVSALRTEVGCCSCMLFFCGKMGKWRKKPISELQSVSCLPICHQTDTGECAPP